MEYRDPDALVSTAWLEAHLDDADLRVFDCTVDLRSVAPGAGVPCRPDSGCSGRGGDPGGLPLREEGFGKCGEAGSWGRPRIGLGAIAFCVLAATSSSFPAGAAGAADDLGEAREVVSVGSLMSTGAVRDMQPIGVIEREEIELSGMRNLWDFLAGRRDYNSFGLDRPYMLGGLRLAVLIDGRSISDSTFDLDSLPVSAVERIEVLSDSAVALYGPRAIAGAINIVLRDRFEGAEVQVGVEHPVRGGGETEHVSALWGGALGAGHLDIGVDLFRRNEIRESQRRYSRASWTPGGSFADTTGVSVFGNTAFFWTAEGLRARSLGDCEGEGFTGPLGDPYGIPGEGCGYAYGDIAWSWERRDRDTLFVGLDHPLGEDHSAYFDARLAQSDFMLPPRSAPMLAALPPTPALPALVFHRFAGHGPREWRADSKEHDLTLGLEGEVMAGIGYDAHLRSHGHDEYREGGTFVQKSVFEHVLAAGAYDLLDPLSTDPAHLEAIRKSGIYQERDRILEHRVARVAFDGQGPTLGGRALGWAAGAEFAYEKRTRDAVYRGAAGDEVPQDDVIGWFDFSFDGERERLSKFAELSIPLQERWDLVLSGRHDDHDDVESTISRQAATRFRLNEGVSLRGSWSKAARAPGIGALHTARIITRPTISDPQTGYRYPITAVNSGNPEPRAESGRELRSRHRGGDGSGDAERGLVPDGSCPPSDHLLCADAAPPRRSGRVAGRRAHRARPANGTDNADRQAGHGQRQARCLRNSFPGAGGLEDGLGRLRARCLVVAPDRVPLSRPRYRGAGPPSTKPRAPRAASQAGRRDGTVERLRTLQSSELLEQRQLPGVGRPRPLGALGGCPRHRRGGCRRRSPQRCRSGAFRRSPGSRLSR